jgi:hypothetical protein
VHLLLLLLLLLVLVLCCAAQAALDLQAFLLASIITIRPFSAVTAPTFWCCASFFPLLSYRFLLCLPFALRSPLWGPACSLLLVAAPAVVTPPSLHQAC